MLKQHFLAVALIMAVGLSSCVTRYSIAGIERSRILIDSRYDEAPDTSAIAFLRPYKRQVDSVMRPVVGRSARYMTAQRPEGTLSNLLADILVWAAPAYSERVDFGVYNMGGVRAALPKGDVTYGDVLDVAPFENKIAFVTLSGAEVLDLFSRMASVGGEAVSHSVRLVISKERQLVSALIDGAQIDPERDYRIATIDYLLGGTDMMTTFKQGRDINSPQEKKNNTRFIIMDYFRAKAAMGEAVDAQIEGRVTIAP